MYGWLRSDGCRLVLINNQLCPGLCWEALLSVEDGAKHLLRVSGMAVSQPLFLAGACCDGSGDRQLLLHTSGSEESSRNFQETISYHQGVSS